MILYALLRGMLWLLVTVLMGVMWACVFCLRLPFLLLSACRGRHAVVARGRRQV